MLALLSCMHTSALHACSTQGIFWIPAQSNGSIILIAQVHSRWMDHWSIFVFLFFFLFWIFFNLRFKSIFFFSSSRNVWLDSPNSKVHNHLPGCMSLGRVTNFSASLSTPFSNTWWLSHPSHFWRSFWSFRSERCFCDNFLWNDEQWLGWSWMEIIQKTKQKILSQI